MLSLRSLLNMLFEITLPQAVLLFGASFLTYTACLAVYRLYFSPYAPFPDPRLAGLTYWYEYYYDVTCGGKYIFHIQELHKQYGPVVRVNPNEIHISDPEFYGEIYHNKSWRTDRDRWYNLDFLGNGLAFTIGHELHAIRRGPMEKFFSMQSIRALEPRIVTVIEGMVDRLQSVVGTEEVVNMYHLGAAVALDVVVGYAFGEDSIGGRIMERAELGKEWSDMTTEQIKINPWSRQWKWAMWLLTKIPPKLLNSLFGNLGGLMKLQEAMWKQIEAVKAQVDREDEGEETAGRETTVFHELFRSKLPPSEKHVLRLQDEASMVVGAGGETTAQVISRTFYHVVANPLVLRRLREELMKAIPDADEMPSLQTLQNLPYLSAVVEEGVRISFPVPIRSPRIFRDNALQYKQWTIQPGMAVGMSNYIVGTDEGIFPEPFNFKPERWLGSKDLQRYATTFGKGRRGCLGKK